MRPVSSLWRTGAELPALRAGRQLRWLTGLRRSAGEGGPADESAFAGPPTGGVTYPYYTTRGPRNFLATNPRGIGPTP